MSNIDKSEGVITTEFAVQDASPLPVNEQFLIYLDDEGDFIIEAQREPLGQFLAAHGATPDDAIYAMRQTLDMVSSMKSSPAAPPSEEVARLQSRVAALEGLLGQYRDSLRPHLYCKLHAEHPFNDLRCDACKQADSILAPLTEVK